MKIDVKQMKYYFFMKNITPIIYTPLIWENYK